MDEQLCERVANFLDLVDLFLELLLSVRDLLEGEEFADDRVIATVSSYNIQPIQMNKVPTTTCM